MHELFKNLPPGLILKLSGFIEFQMSLRELKSGRLTGSMFNPNSSTRKFVWARAVPPSPGVARSSAY
ncbi:hypothetical protein [uncultured Paenibacillus sp.]|uniref:hypothetical protein n=1 Tax=uncultured Paenibacillus sp. TaxID=227322 RepID=UPI0015AD0CCC|nr:hypothetical protein [uncultured Paenibacillus sp.]